MKQIGLITLLWLADELTACATDAAPTRSGLLSTVSRNAHCAAVLRQLFDFESIPG